MKKHFITLLTLVVSAMMSFTACNTFNDDNVLSYDGQTLVEQTVPTVSADQRIIVNESGTGTVAYTASVAMDVRCTASNVILSNNGNGFSYTLPTLSGPTRDIEFYLEPTVRTKYSGYGYYAYPFRLRQYGTYTQYKSAGELTSFIDKVDINDQWYAKGIVVAVGSIEEDTYPISKYPVNPLFFYDRGAMFSASEQECPSNLGEKFVTVTVAIDGQNVKFLVNDLARDIFLDAFVSSLHPGAEVEISLYRASWNSTFGGIINVNPFAFYTK